jgi:mono/diheme cytochrome c family protein
MGEMFFVKLRGCGACHQSKPGVGGFSGPELYTAGARLQPDFIYAYIKDPQKIDPHIWMPTLALSEPDLQRLTSYIAHLGQPAETK